MATPISDPPKWSVGLGRLLPPYHGSMFCLVPRYRILLGAFSNDVRGCQVRVIVERSVTETYPCPKVDLLCAVSAAVDASSGEGSLQLLLTGGQ